MKNKYITILLSFCFILPSCQTNYETFFSIDKKLSIDIKSAVADPLYQEVDFIPLETNENSFVSFINKIVIYKDTIVVHSMRDKYVAFFSKDGEFLYRFPVGEGPGELLYPADIAVDKDAGTLWVLDRYRSMKEYDFQGNFLREVISEQSYLRMDRYKDVLMLFESYMNRDNLLLFKFIIDSDVQEELYFIDKDPRFAKLPYIQTNAFCPVNDSICYFYHQYDDCIYAWNYNTKEVSIGVDISYINGKSIKKGWDKSQELEVNIYQDFYNNRE
ncbi:MAG: 6-bladed beta-propeller, partial [Tannerellaceae bacterium]|nr:6-bladed beta-propeller [Tannerellaceae bacterium]